MTDMSREEALAHFGVKGQKWGVRNERRKAAAQNLVDSKKQKIERGKEAREKRPRPTKKQAAIIGTSFVGAAAATALLIKYGPQVAERGKWAVDDLKDLMLRKSVEDLWEPVSEESIKQIMAERADEVAYWTQKFTDLSD